MKMKNIVFDLGGVVVDWNPQRVLDEYPGGSEMPTALFRDGFFEKHWPDFDRGMVSQEEIVREMSRFSGRSVDECGIFVEYVKHSLRDIPQTVELIGDLSRQGYRLFCLSNMSVEYYDYLKGREVFTYFEGQIISAYEKVIKPEEAIYRILMERYSLEAGETLFIDDLESNLVTARRLGLHTVNFADRGRGYQEISEKLKVNSEK